MGVSERFLLPLIVIAAFIAVTFVGWGDRQYEKAIEADLGETFQVEQKTHLKDYKGEGYGYVRFTVSTLTEEELIDEMYQVIVSPEKEVVAKKKLITSEEKRLVLSH